MNDLWRSIVKPPYRGLPWAVWFYVVASALIVGHGGVFNGHLIGFDDQVRMTQVVEWINGHGWYDRTILRANPPQGFTTIWSRLVDIPIALVVIIAQQFVTQKVAALVAAFVVPMSELAVLFCAAPYFARPLVGKDKARLIILFLIFTSILNVKFFSVSGFLVGEASHHPWYIILNLTMLGAVARLAMGSAESAPVLMLGGSTALLTAVGIEGYPLIAGAAGIVALVAWAGNRPLVAGRGGTAFLCGAFVSLLLVPVHQPPQNFFLISFAEPSLFAAILLGLAGAFLKIEESGLKRWGKNKITSAVILAVLAVVFAAGLVAAFPRILDGAAAGLSPAERTMALSEHFEAQPVYKLARNWLEEISLLMPSVIALAAAGFALSRTRGRRRAVAACYLGFAVIGTGMSELFSRYYHHAMTTACAWLLWVWEYVKQRLRGGETYAVGAVVAFVMLGPFWMLLLPSFAFGLPDPQQILFFPAAIQIADDPCDSLALADFIDAHYPARTLLVVPAAQSSAFLYQTDVRLDFLANYPSYDKFIDNQNFFAARDVDLSQEIATRHGIDLVAVCLAPLLYNFDARAEGQPLWARLQVGRVPEWLQRIDTSPIRTNYFLYQVKK